MGPESRDLNIATVLADPMIAAMMKADRVAPRDLEALLRGKARQFALPLGPHVPAGLLACTKRLAARRACFA
jgi:hypothetical protein